MKVNSVIVMNAQKRLRLDTILSLLTLREIISLMLISKQAKAYVVTFLSRVDANFYVVTPKFRTRLWLDLPRLLDKIWTSGYVINVNERERAGINTKMREVWSRLGKTLMHQEVATFRLPVSKKGDKRAKILYIFATVLNIPIWRKKIGKIRVIWMGTLSHEEIHRNRLVQEGYERMPGILPTDKAPSRCFERCHYYDSSMQRTARLISFNFGDDV